MQVFAREENIGNLAKTGNTTVQLSPSVITIGARQYETNNLVCDIALSGVGGLDLGSIQPNKVYYVYAVVSGISASLIASLSITNPIGFISSKYVGAIQISSLNQILMVSQSDSFDTAIETFIPVIGATITPPTLGTISRNNMRWRRSKEFYEAIYEFKQTSGGSTGNGTYLFPLKSGCVIDTTKQSLNNGSEEIVGPAWVSNTADGTGDTSRIGVVNPYDASNFKLQVKPATDLSNAVGSVTFALNSATMIYTFTARVPILGWEAKIGRKVEGK